MVCDWRRCSLIDWSMQNTVSSLEFTVASYIYTFHAFEVDKCLQRL